MTETLMNIGAVTVELGLPAGLLILMALKPGIRPRAVVMLGAIFPLLCLYAVVAASYLSSGGTADIFSFYAMWIMTFAVYVAVAVGGLAVSFFRRPKNHWARFGLGVLSTPVAYLLLEFTARIISW
jgi:hypothetical protein